MATIGAIPSPPTKWKDEEFETPGIVADTITLWKAPKNGALFVFLNGLYLTKGSSYDYILSGNEIIFNSNVLTTNGHVAVKYGYI